MTQLSDTPQAAADANVDAAGARPSRDDGARGGAAEAGSRGWPSVRFLRQLRCPSCGDSLALTARWPATGPNVRSGILVCPCSKYPIVEGIVVLRAAGAEERVSFRRATECLARGNERDALAWCLVDSVSAPRHVVLGMLERLGAGVPILRDFSRRRRGVQNRDALSKAGLTFCQALDRVKARLFRDYLYRRFASPSLHAALPVIALLKEISRSAASAGRAQVLDLACGVGHSSFLMKSLFPDLAVVMADHDFTNLFLARRFLAPGAPAVCLDAERRLPFADRTFAAAFCMDAFHYIVSKQPLAREMDRVVDADGMLLLPHLHNALVYNPAAGHPVTPAEYLKLWGGRDVRAFAEPRLLADFVGGGAIDLREAGDPAALEQANALTLVSGPAGLLWRAHDVADAYRSARPLGLNPLYRAERHGSSVRLLADPLEPALRDEWSAARAYMPDAQQVDAATWDRLLAGSCTPADRATRAVLQNAFVLVPLPPDYGSVTFPNEAA
jgi:SAM-dependent methyltransferase